MGGGGINRLLSIAVMDSGKGKTYSDVGIAKLVLVLDCRAVILPYCRDVILL